jgi:hypothetical protein
MLMLSVCAVSRRNINCPILHPILHLAHEGYITTMTRWKPVLGLFVVVLLLGAIAGGCWDFARPHAYRHAISPDGNWSVTVFRQRVPPYIEGVAVIVRVQDSKGHLLYYDKITTCDLWSDVEKLCSEVLIDDQRIMIGPDYWGPNDYFQLTKKDLEQGRPVPTRLNSSKLRSGPVESKGGGVVSGRPIGCRGEKGTHPAPRSLGANRQLIAQVVGNGGKWGNGDTLVNLQSTLTLRDNSREGPSRGGPSPR